MASPLGHALAGLALGRAFDDSSERRTTALLVACVVLALAPDLDFLPGLLQGQPVLYHQGPSHSLVVGLALSLGVALLLRPDRRQLLRTWLLLFAAFGSHLVIDSLGRDRRPPIGMPLLWPFSDTSWLAPVTLLPGVNHAVSGSESPREWLAMVFSWINVRAILAEVLLVGPLLILVEGLRRRRGR
jgi:membrane-bound metal-dependent hydrolase YbcI (DUF457 family)